MHEEFEWAEKKKFFWMPTQSLVSFIEGSVVFCIEGYEIDGVRERVLEGILSLSVKHIF